MKNYENQALLDHKRKFDAARKEAALAKKAQQVLRNRHAMAKVAGKA